MPDQVPYHHNKWQIIISAIQHPSPITTPTTTSGDNASQSLRQGLVVTLLVAALLASAAVAFPDAIPEPKADAEPTAHPDADPEAHPDPEPDAEPDAEAEAKPKPSSSPLSDPEGRLEPEKPHSDTTVNPKASPFFGYEPTTTTETNVVTISSLARAHTPPRPNPTRHRPIRLRKRFGLAKDSSRDRVRARNRRRNGNRDASRVEIIKRLPVTFGKRVTLRDSIDKGSFLPTPSPIQPEGPEAPVNEPVFQSLEDGLFRPTPSPLVHKSSAPFPLTPRPLAFEDSSPVPPGNLRVTKLNPFLSTRTVVSPKPTVLGVPRFEINSFGAQGKNVFNTPSITTSRPFETRSSNAFDAPNFGNNVFENRGKSIFNAPSITNSKPFDVRSSSIFNAPSFSTNSFENSDLSVFNSPSLTSRTNAFNAPRFKTKSSGQSHSFTPSTLDFSSPDPHRTFSRSQVLPPSNIHFQNDPRRFPDRPSSHISGQIRPSRLVSLSPKHRFSFSSPGFQRDPNHPPRANSAFSSGQKDLFQPGILGHSTFNPTIRPAIHIPVHQPARPPIHPTVSPGFQSTARPPIHSTVLPPPHDAVNAVHPTVPPPVHSTANPVIQSTVQEEVHPVIQTTVSPPVHSEVHSVLPTPLPPPALPEPIVRRGRLESSYILPDAHYKPMPKKVKCANFITVSWPLTLSKMIDTAGHFNQITD